MNFAWSVQAFFVTKHIMAERGIKGPTELMLKLGYDLQIEDPARWTKIVKLYELAIHRCIKEGLAKEASFKYVPLTQ